MEFKIDVGWFIGTSIIKGRKNTISGGSTGWGWYCVARKIDQCYLTNQRGTEFSSRENNRHLETLLFLFFFLPKRREFLSTFG